MKRLFVISLILIFVILTIASCTSQKSKEQLMQEAEDYFSENLKENIFDIYPNPLIATVDTKAEAWPAFYNKENKAIIINFLASCPFKTDYPKQAFTVKPNDEQIFALIIDTTSESLGDHECLLLIESNKSVLTSKKLTVRIR